MEHPKWLLILQGPFPYSFSLFSSLVWAPLQQWTKRSSSRLQVLIKPLLVSLCEILIGQHKSQGQSQSWSGTGLHRGMNTQKHGSLGTPMWENTTVCLLALNDTCLSYIQSTFSSFPDIQYHPTSASGSGLGSSTLLYKSVSHEDVVPRMSPYIQHSMVKIGKDNLNNNLSKNGSRGRRQKVYSYCSIAIL